MARPCGEFKAKLEKRPDLPGTLTVTGECSLPATYRAVLKPHDPPSDDPDTLLLDLDITLPSGLPSTVVEGLCTLNMTHKQKTEIPYKKVVIIDVNSEEGQTWEVPVRMLTQELAHIRPDGTKWTKMSRPDRV